MFKRFQIFNHYILIVSIYVECIFQNQICNWKLSKKKQIVWNNNIVTPTNHYGTECLPGKLIQPLSIIRSQMLKKYLLPPIYKTKDRLLQLPVFLAFDRV